MLFEVDDSGVYRLTNSQLVGALESDVVSEIEGANLTAGRGNDTIDVSSFTLGSTTLSGGLGMTLWMAAAARILSSKRGM